MRVLTVVSHPRKRSLTYSIAESFVNGLKDARHTLELFDLYQEKFDPVLYESDEPDWNDPTKRYSSAVEQEIERMKRNDAIAVIFPIWWFSLPAITKGWIDRVWNYGFAYGDGHQLPHKKILWIALAAETEPRFTKRGYDQMLQHHLNDGIAGYCGIHDSTVKIMYNTLGAGVHEDGVDAASAFYQTMLQDAYDLGRTF